MQTVMYFAYGSNMLTRRLARRCPSAGTAGVGYVEGKRLVFTKVSKDGSGKCHIEDTGDNVDRVYGVLYTIDIGDKIALDAAEGLGKGYREESIAVTVPDVGSVVAVTYIATRTDADIIPYDWYKALVLQGAIEHQLPACSLALIRNHPAKPDPDDARRLANQGLLLQP